MPFAGSKIDQRMKLNSLFLSIVIPTVIARELALSARHLNTGQVVELGSFHYDEGANNISKSEPASSSYPYAGAYCIDASFDQGRTEFPCFSFLELQNPLHYSLVVDLHGDEISKLTLTYDSDVNDINPVIRRPESAPEAPAIKLKKVTKTYKDKKAAQNKATAQYEDSEELDTRSWMQKNWKMLAIGLVAYNIIAFTGRQQQRQE